MSTLAIQNKEIADTRVLSLRERISAWRYRPKPVTVYNILVAAEQGRLNALLNSHYTIYYDAQWQSKLKLCRDLVEADYLKAEFDEHFDGSPIFINDDTRLTIAGRDYLGQLQENRISQRLLHWTSPIVSAILSGSIVGYIVWLLSKP